MQFGQFIVPIVLTDLHVAFLTPYAPLVPSRPVIPLSDDLGPLEVLLI